MDAKALEFGGSGICQREAWVTGIFNQVKSFLSSYGNAELKTCSSPPATTLMNSYVRGQIFPFINIPIRYRDKELLGLYEYYGEQLPLKADSIYCDFVVQAIYYHEQKSQESIKAIEERTRQILTSQGYQILVFEDGMATISLDRNILNNPVDFKNRLKNLLDTAIKIQVERI
jgi:hypothetical protein